MEEELFIGLPAAIAAEATVTYEFPENRRYLLQNTPAEITRWSGGSMARQALKGDNFVAEICILDTRKPFTTDLRVKKQNVIFFYTIKGYFSYRNNINTFQILQDESAIFQVRPGHFQMRVLPGHHVYFFFYLKFGLLKTLTNDYEGLKPLLTMIPQEQIIRPTGRIAQSVNQALFKLRQIRKDGKIAELNMEGIILELISLTQSKPENNKKGHQKTTRDIILEIRGFIGTEINQGAVLTIRKIADVFNLTPRRLSEVFHDLFGIPLGSYINARRMEVGYRLLTEEKMSVADVAQYLGYQDPANFSRSFKNYFGFPPGSASGKVP